MCVCVCRSQYIYECFSLEVVLIIGVGVLKKKKKSFNDVLNTFVNDVVGAGNTIYLNLFLLDITDGNRHK